MNRGDEAADFERWLDRELPDTIAAELRAAEPPARPAYRTAPGQDPVRRGLARLGAGGAAAGVAMALALAGGGAALATGSANPVIWGQQVVQACTDPVGPDEQTGASMHLDVGRCVGNLAGQHSSSTPAGTRTVQPVAPASSAPGVDGDSSGGGKAKDHAQDQTQATPIPSASPGKAHDNGNGNGNGHQPQGHGKNT